LPDSDLTLLTQAARAAGAIALRYWKQSPDAWDKGGGAGPVSEADLAVNAMLEHDLCTARPDYGWLSEESDDNPDRLRAERTFIVDPIDGTRAFLAGERSFAQSLAVAQNGKVTAAVVHLPALDLTYTATAEGDACLNDLPLRVGGVSRIEEAQVLSSSATLDPQNWRGPAPGFRRVFRPSLAWRFCLVAEGRFDAVLSLRPAWEWDIAAGSLIAARAGALATDRSGKPLCFNSATAAANGLVVAPAALHADLMSHLRPWPG
jgi:myo-inositol-1(or 4)-monophosphatase